MKLQRAIRSARAILGSTLAGRPTPLIVSWRLVNRCNLRCLYCQIPERPTEELTTDEVLETLRGLRALGTQHLNFTGGEALLRKDIDRILACAADLGFLHSLNSNGALVPDKIDALRRLSMLSLSLDGAEQAHDAARGRGSHRQVMRAMETAQAAGIPVSLAVTLSSHNLAEVSGLLDLAAHYRVRISFQPATLQQLGSTHDNPITPQVEAYRAVTARLIALKRSGNPWIVSSRTTLEHLALFPDPRAIPCQAGRLYFRIEANGDVLACTDTARPEAVANVRRDGLIRALELTRPAGCNSCWGSARVEFNHAAALRIEPIVNILRTR